MTELDQALSRLLAHEGVEHLLLIGRDGLPVHRAGAPPAFDLDRVAAMTPELVTACDALGSAARRGLLATAVLEFDSGVAIVAPLSTEVLLGVMVRPGVGFAPLLRELRRERDRLARLL